MTATAGNRTTELTAAGLDGQNKATLGRMLGSGNIGHAAEDANGRMSATVRIREDELCWDPDILVLPHGGDLDLTLINDDKNAHWFLPVMRHCTSQCRADHAGADNDQVVVHLCRSGIDHLAAMKLSISATVLGSPAVNTS